MTTEENVAIMKRELIHDLGEAVREARQHDEANLTRHWVKDRQWKHEPSDDFEGCVE